jgi:hypothetical protein
MACAPEVGVLVLGTAHGDKRKFFRAPFKSIFRDDSVRAAAVALGEAFTN